MRRLRSGALVLVAGMLAVLSVACSSSSVDPAAARSDTVKDTVGAVFVDPCHVVPTDVVQGATGLTATVTLDSDATCGMNLPNGMYLQAVVRRGDSGPSWNEWTAAVDCSTAPNGKIADESLVQTCGDMRRLLVRRGTSRLMLEVDGATSADAQSVEEKVATAVAARL